MKKISNNNIYLITLSAVFIIIISAFIFLFPKENKSSVNDIDNNDCIKSGCSGQLCVNKNENVMTTCEWKEIYKCYKLAPCEKQTDGKFHFTPNQEFTKCLNDNR